MFRGPNFMLICWFLKDVISLLAILATFSLENDSTGIEIECVANVKIWEVKRHRFEVFEAMQTASKLDSLPRFDRRTTISVPKI